MFRGEKIGLHGRVTMEGRERQCTDARRRREKDEAFVYRRAVLALHDVRHVSAHFFNKWRDWDCGPAGPSASDENSLGFVRTVSGHGFIVRLVPRPRDSEKIPGQARSWLEVERPGPHLPAARRVLRRGPRVGRRGLRPRLSLDGHRPVSSSSCASTRGLPRSERGAARATRSRVPERRRGRV